MITPTQTRLVSYYNSLNKRTSLVHRQYHRSCTKYLLKTSTVVAIVHAAPPRPAPENIRHSQRRHRLPRRPYCYLLSSPCVNRPPTPTTLTAPPGSSPREYVRYSPRRHTRTTELWRLKFRVKYVRASLTMHTQKYGQRGS